MELTNKDKDKQKDIAQDQNQQEGLKKQDQQNTTPQGDGEGLQDGDKTKDIQAELETLRKRVQELEQYEPKTKSEEQLALEQKEQELWQKEVNLTLKEHNLEPFAPFVRAKNSEELTAQIESLQAILVQMKLDNTFVPSQHKLTDKYSLAESNKDSKGMISAKLSGLFK